MILNHHYNQVDNQRNQQGKEIARPEAVYQLQKRYGDRNGGGGVKYQQNYSLYIIYIAVGSVPAHNTNVAKIDMAYWIRLIRNR